jgi:hypothetical protein
MTTSGGRAGGGCERRGGVGRDVHVVLTRTEVDGQGPAQAGVVIHDQDAAHR